MAPDHHTSEYAELLTRKMQVGGAQGFDPDWMPDFLFPFQKALVDWAIRQGRAAIFADCGLGKTPMQLVWAENARRHTGKPALIITPLAVAFQTEHEAAKFGIEAAVSRDGSVAGPITITNYDRLHHFNREDYGAVVCDESSAIKSFDGQRRALVTDFVRKTPYRLFCTATAAPNDYIELGTSSEALGHLGYMDMLSRFFTNKERTSKMRSGQRRPDPEDGWRFKGHAEEWFWRWVASWARAMRKPSDFGFPDEGFILPELTYGNHVIEAETPREGLLFDLPANRMSEEREESRRTIQERCERAASLLDTDAAAVAWCQLNAEGDLLTRLIDGAVQVSGSDSPERKEEVLIAFSRGDIRVLVTKPIIGAWGLNWQHCSHMTYFPSHSYEQFYQAVRRCWRFGQKQSVTVDVVTTTGGSKALANLERKATQADRMFESLVAHMRDAMHIDRTNTYNQKVSLPAWVTS
jgi:superfamily II DNA or RNA helicase